MCINLFIYIWNLYRNELLQVSLFCHVTSGFETVYTGSETEFVCDRLTPGTTYQLRVSCISAGGRSSCSDPCIVTTEAVCPAKCLPPRVHGKPRATTLSLRWSKLHFIAN